MAKKKNPDGKIIKRAIPFKLNEKEKSERGEQAGKLNEELKAAVEKRKIVMRDHNEKIKGLTNRVNKLLEQIHEGQERREAEVVEHKNFEKNTMEYYLDGDVVDKRPMTAEDRQLDLVTKGDNKKPKEKWARMAPKYRGKQEESESEEIASVHKIETSKRGATSSVDPK